MKIPMPTAKELARIRTLIEQSRVAGLDPVGALRREGFLLFDEYRALLISQALDQLAVMIEEMTVKQMAELLERRMPTSPLDTKRYIVELIYHTRDGLMGGMNG